MLFQLVKLSSAFLAISAEEKPHLRILITSAEVLIGAGAMGLDIGLPD